MGVVVECKTVSNSTGEGKSSSAMTDLSEHDACTGTSTSSTTPTLATALTQNGYALRHASDILKGDRNTVLAAIKQDGCALKYASKAPKGDKDNVLATVTQDGRALQYSSEGMQNDRDIVNAAVTQDGDALRHASDILKGDKDVVLATVTHDGRALQYSSEGMQNDMDIVDAAVTQDGDVLRHASDILKGDRNAVLTAVTLDGCALKYVSKALKGDRDIVLAALTHNGLALEYASDELKGDEAIVLAALAQNGRALEYASDELKVNKDVLAAANAHQPKIGTSSLDTAAAAATTAIATSITSSINPKRTTSEEPPSKRIKLENNGATTATPTSNTVTSSTTTSAASAAIDTRMTMSSNPVAPSITTPICTAVMGSLGATEPLASATASASHDTAITSASAAMGSATATTTQSQMPTPTPTPTITVQNQQGIRVPHISSPACSKPPAASEVSVKDEASQGGYSSVVTVPIGESSPQHTSQSSDNTSNSSNDSLHESATPATAIARNTTATAPPGVNTRLPNNSSTRAAQRTTAAVAVTTAPLVSRPPPIEDSTTPRQASSLTTVTAATKVVAATTIATKPRPTGVTTVPKESPSEVVPLKALNFGHLRIKYLGELEYMLREFRKLERQLLGAKGAAQLEESAGSRERREKLHSFILHLEDTIRQIELGCKLEDEGKSTTAAAGAAATSTKNGKDNGDAVATATGSGNNPAIKIETTSTDAAAEEAKKKMAEESALSNLTKEKEEEENVQKLEEHILANLLPVKVRLKKQLAAQQGAAENPAGMPSLRRAGMQPSSTTRGKGTFVEAVEKKRKQAEAVRLAAQAQHERQVRSVSDPTQFGKALSGVGSSLTKKLHGSTLGSKQRRTGHGVGSSTISNAPKLKILHAGMVPKSTQQKSGLSAASGAHEMVTITSNQNNNNKSNVIANSVGSSATAVLAANTGGKSTPIQPSQVAKKTTIVAKPKRTIVPKVEPKSITTTASDEAMQKKSAVNSSSAPLSEEDKLKFKKHRRLRKLKRLKRRRERELAKQQLPKSQQIPNSNTQTPSNVNPPAIRKKAAHGKGGQKKKGPRVVEYICSLCSEAYSSTCDFNPWWALAQHKCPKCQKTQIPRIDITSPANIIEYHPALLSHLEDGGRGGGNAGSIPTAQALLPTSMPIVSQVPGTGGASSVNSESDSDLSELSDDNISIGSLKAAELESDLQSMTPAERAEHETFGNEYEGPCLSEDHAAKLLILMGHASTCPCHHKSEKTRDVCRATKYMMLHVRDCPGTTSTFDVCPFPWCRKVKHLLYHLVSCTEPDQCAICSPKDLPKGLEGLVGLNAHRMKRHRERMIALAKASLAAKGTKTNSATENQPTIRRTASAAQANNLRKVISGAKLSITQQAPVAQRPAPAPVKPKIESVSAPATSCASTTTNVVSVDTGGNNSNNVRNPVAAQPQTSISQPTTQVKAGSNDLVPTSSINDFDINAEIAKLDEQLRPSTFDVKEASQSHQVAVKQEAETSTTVPNVKVETNAVACPPNKYMTMPSDGTSKATGISTDAEQVLPTPMSAIKMEDHDDDDLNILVEELAQEELTTLQKSISRPAGFLIPTQQDSAVNMQDLLIE